MPIGVRGAAIAVAVVLFVAVLARAIGGLSFGIKVFLLFVALSAVLGAVLQHFMSRAGGSVARAVVSPSGASTPYTPTFSHIDAMVARGELDEAAQEFAAQCEAHPENGVIWVKAADFDLRIRDEPRAARARYEHVRNLPQVHADLARYASQKLIDLHLGPLEDEGRALVELRRFIERFPATREAEEAKAVLARLKESRRSG